MAGKQSPGQGQGWAAPAEQLQPPRAGEPWLGGLQWVSAAQHSLWAHLKGGQGVPKLALSWLLFLAARLQQAWLGHRRANCYKRLKASFKIVLLYQWNRKQREETGRTLGGVR